MKTISCHPLPRSIAEPASLTLAGVIRERREALGWSLTELAERARLSRQMVSFVETHRRVPSADVVLRLARALGARASDLFRQAERRAARWPAACQQCNYSCVDRGRLKWWNPRRGCIRPEK
jgi:transcriptional regulator with XRE-family HTH domain